MAAPRSVGDTDRVSLWKNLQSFKEDNQSLRSRVEELESELAEAKREAKHWLHLASKTRSIIKEPINE